MWKWLPPRKQSTLYKPMVLKYFERHFGHTNCEACSKFRKQSFTGFLPSSDSSHLASLHIPLRHLIEIDTVGKTSSGCNWPKLVARSFTFEKQKTECQKRHKRIGNPAAWQPLVVTLTDTDPAPPTKLP